MCGERKANVKEQTNKRIIQSKLRLEMRIPEHKIKSQSQIRDGQDVLDRVTGVKAEAIQSMVQTQMHKAVSFSVCWGGAGPFELLLRSLLLGFKGT